MQNKFGKKKIIVLGAILVSILLLAGCTDTSNNGSEGDNQETGDADSNSGNSGSSDNSNGYAVNVDPNMVGNWTWSNGTSGGEPVTHISSGWVNFKGDGTFNSYYDYGYTVVVYEGTWQAKDGELYWGTNGHEISDWYSYDNYELVSNNELSITSNGGESRYQKQ